MTQEDYLRIYRSMREIALQHHQDTADYFDREFSSNLSMFDPRDYIRDGGQISLKFSFYTLQKTLRSLSEYSKQKAQDQPLYRDNWMALGTTFWNTFVESTLATLVSQVPGAYLPVAHHVRKSNPLLAQGDPQDQDTVEVAGPSRCAEEDDDVPIDDEDLRQELLAVRGILPIYRGKSGCQPGCKPCLSIFDTLPLSQCIQMHSGPDFRRCVPSGWFPHMSSSQWRAIRPAHLHPGFVYRPRPVQWGQRRNPLTQPLCNKPGESILLQTDQEHLDLEPSEELEETSIARDENTAGHHPQSLDHLSSMCYHATSTLEDRPNLGKRRPSLQSAVNVGVKRRHYNH